MEYIIWSNLDLEGLEKEIKEEKPWLTEYELHEEAERLNEEYLGDERMNLNIQLNNDIVVIGDLGRWNGRYISVGTLKSRNIGSCLQPICDYTTWYVGEDGELRCDAIHHDGTNRYMFRTLKEGVHADDIAFFDDFNEARRVILEKTESLGPVICGVYGWNVVA